MMEEALRRAQVNPDAMAALAWVPANLGTAYDALGQFARSEALYRAELERARKSFGPDNPRTVAAMLQFGMSLLRQERWSQAEPLFRESLALQAKTHPDAWSTFNIRSQLGGALLGQSLYAQAEPLVVQGYEGMITHKATMPPRLAKARLTEAAERLVRLYEQWGRPGEAAVWKARLSLENLDAMMPIGAAAFAH
jgi:tetratricopeptide (TPR) repeat protein